MIDVRSVIPSPRARGASGCHLVAVGLRGEQRAGLHRGAIGDHGAGAAIRGVASSDGFGKAHRTAHPARSPGGAAASGTAGPIRRGSARRAGTVPPMVEHQRVITDLIAPIRADWAAVQYDAG
jgi:hypothetical protein